MSRGFFPLDDQLRICETHWSEKVAQQAVWLYGQVDDDLAEQILQTIGGLAISDTSIWRRAQKWGEKIRVAEKARATAVIGLPQRGEIVRGSVPHERSMGGAMDGGMIYIRGEKWKEFKVATFFDIEPRLVYDPMTQAQEWQAHAIRNSYVAVLGGSDAFGRLAWAEAVRREFPEAIDSVMLGDAAAWIWNLIAEHFSPSRQLVDWYHAQEHLWTAANAVFGEGSAKAQQWVKAMETPLYQGHATRITEELKSLAQRHRRVGKALRTEAGYFQNNQRRMQYQEMREDGFPIGSGMVESGIKQFRARFTGPGMRWERQKVERILPIRAAIMSNRFDAVWTGVYNLPPN